MCIRGYSRSPRNSLQYWHCYWCFACYLLGAAQLLTALQRAKGNSCALSNMGCYNVKQERMLQSTTEIKWHLFVAQIIKIPSYRDIGQLVNKLSSQHSPPWSQPFYLLTFHFLSTEVSTLGFPQTVEASEEMQNDGEDACPGGCCNITWLYRQQIRARSVMALVIWVSKNTCNSFVYPFIPAWFHFSERQCEKEFLSAVVTHMVTISGRILSHPRPSV